VMLLSGWTSGGWADPKSLILAVHSDFKLMLATCPVTPCLAPQEIPVSIYCLTSQWIFYSCAVLSCSLFTICPWVQMAWSKKACIVFWWSRCNWRCLIWWWIRGWQWSSAYYAWNCKSTWWVWCLWQHLSIDDHQQVQVQTLTELGHVPKIGHYSCFIFTVHWQMGSTINHLQYCNGHAISELADKYVFQLWSCW
jgi:hypothetical protein